MPVLVSGRAEGGSAMTTRSCIGFKQCTMGMRSYIHTCTHIQMQRCSTHMNATPTERGGETEKVLWHILTFAGLETVLISQSEIQRHRHTEGERQGILTHCSRLPSRPHHHLCKLLCDAAQTKFLLQNKDFKHSGHQCNRTMRNLIWFQSQAHLPDQAVQVNNKWAENLWPGIILLPCCSFEERKSTLSYFINCVWECLRVWLLDDLCMFIYVHKWICDHRPVCAASTFVICWEI